MKISGIYIVIIWLPETSHVFLISQSFSAQKGVDRLEKKIHIIVIKSIHSCLRSES